jgi:acyl-homoserine-lactone acylase
MKRLLPILASAWAMCVAPLAASTETERWQQEAQAITIIRDDWGIPHIYGRTDADAVFGLIYAQAEDDFNRVETNYLNAMGRLAEAEGEAAVYRDLRMKLFVDPEQIKERYRTSPAWLKALMEAWADGLNHYLHTHPGVAPRVIRRFEPWMALTFTEGSIGADIETVSVKELEAFYGERPVKEASAEGAAGPAEPAGSNGIAIAPANTAAHHALLLINPHTSFFFRAEVQVVSEEGLDAYGAVTWGQFFVYQGFNERVGWMHTSSGVDAIDEYAETVVKKGGSLFYRYGQEERPLLAKTIVVPYRTASGMARREFTVYSTHHGPIVREADGKWVSVKLMQEPVKALIQSFTRTKARSYQAFRETMELHTNSSNNTVFADADGNIAYFHANFIPKRDPRLDWRRPVEGSDPATEWQGLLSVAESPNVLNPPNGWIQNTNNWPYSAAGANSPRREDYPRYVETGIENPRGLHAIRVLQDRKDFTLDSLVAAAYDPYLTAFVGLIPSLLSAYDQAPPSDPLKARLSEQVKLLREWDFRWSVDSVPTTLAVFWGEELWRQVRANPESEDTSIYELMVTRTTPEQRLQALAVASDQLQADFGSWKTAWREINRFQRLTGDIVQPFTDAGPSIPVGFTSSRWGSLAAFGARAYKGTKKLYGTSGNSFVAVVEFGDRVRAKAVTAGGESGHPGSPHFNDQAARYAKGELRDVYFYRPQLTGHIERQYHPGDDLTVSPRARTLHQGAIVVDTHADTTQRLPGFDLSARHADGHLDIPRMRQGGLDAVFFSIWTTGTRPGAEALEHAIVQIDAVREAVRSRPRDLVLATTAGEIRRAHADGRIAVLLGVEGGHMIADDLGVLRILASLGMRYLTLTHTKNTSWADSSGDKPAHGGLTVFGRKVVAELNRQGVMIDISHVSDKTFDDVLEISLAPVIASHSSMRAIANHPRNMTDDMLRRLASQGGVVQINYHTEFLSQPLLDAERALGKAFEELDRQVQAKCGEDELCGIAEWERLQAQLTAEGKLPKVSWEQIIEHIDHAVKVAGADHVGLGSDFDGAWMPRGMEDASKLPQITEALLRSGYSDEDVRKILGGNLLRVTEQVERAARDLGGNTAPPAVGAR